MINKEIYKLLNDQWNKEIASAYIYYEKAALVRDIGMFNYYDFLKKSGDDELAHAQKFYDYMISVDSLPKVNDYIRPNVSTTSSIMETTKLLYDHEVNVSNSINIISKFALEINDFGTFEFIQWFVKEQVEEEAKFLNIIKLAKLTQSDSELDDKIGSFDLTKL
ncbi:MAG: ferritin-like domain-containing protein [Malacoplasma sp.]